jgi:hypothetical protein
MKAMSVYLFQRHGLLSLAGHGSQRVNISPTIISYQIFVEGHHYTSSPQLGSPLT